MGFFGWLMVGVFSFCFVLFSKAVGTTDSKCSLSDRANQTLSIY